MNNAEELREQIALNYILWQKDKLSQKEYIEKCSSLINQFKSDVREELRNELNRKGFNIPKYI